MTGLVSIAGSRAPWNFLTVPWKQSKRISSSGESSVDGRYLWSVRAPVNLSPPRSHDIPEPNPGVDYGYENVDELRKALEPNLENEAWANVPFGKDFIRKIATSRLQI
jgi:hypothetical protein